MPTVLEASQGTTALSKAQWVLLCAGAEAIGMTATRDGSESVAGARRRAADRS